MPHPPERLGIAVSGGSDSTALLFLLADLGRKYGIELHALTVNHGLRPGAVAEIVHVAGQCAALGIAHHILRWRDWDGTGNKQDAARRARYALMSAWARDAGVQTVALGHTADDQAETVLMRLARGSGVDGLTAMVPRRIQQGLVWIRPLLETRREVLRDYLRKQEISWCEDPSNQDSRYERVRVREALKQLAPLGIDTESLGQVAFNMSRARDALDWQSFLVAREMVQVRAGAIAIDWRGYRTLPDEIARRLLVNALKWIGGSEYPPRRRAVFGVIATLKQTPSATLDGCMIRRIDDTLWIFRELHAVRDVRCNVSGLWDGRWHFKGPQMENERLHVAALGEAGLRDCVAWRDSGLPRDLLLASPGIWDGEVLCAAPLAGVGRGWSAQMAKGDDAFFAKLLSH